jgi:hypothetical protein
MTYNMGAGWWKSWPDLSKAMARGDYASVSSQISRSKYAAQVGGRAANNSEMIAASAGKTSGTALASNAAANNALPASPIADSTSKSVSRKSFAQLSAVSSSTPVAPDSVTPSTQVQDVQSSTIESAVQTAQDSSVAALIAETKKNTPEPTPQPTIIRQASSAPSSGGWSFSSESNEFSPLIILVNSGIMS